MTEVEAAPISFADPSVQRCPFPAYDALRADQPVYRDPLTGNFVLTRYADVRRSLLNPKVFSNRTGLIVERASSVQDEVDRIYRDGGWMPLDTLVSNDPPEHRLYRVLVDKVFTTPRVTGLEPRIEAIIDALLDDLPAGTEFDFLDAFAVRLPMYVIAEQLGVARADMDRFKLWSDVSVEAVSPMIPPAREIEIAQTIVDLQNYLARVIERVRAAPEDTLISHLASTETEGRLLTMRELLGVIQQLLVAGNETTTTTLASGMKLLIDHPDLAERMAVDPALVPRFVEEALRTCAPIQTLFRKALEDVEVDGVTIPAGAMVEVRYGAANRDPAQFACPADVDLSRANAAGHLAFGAGIHMCIGNQLARGELRLAFAALTRRFKNFRATRGDGGVEWATSYIAYGPTRLWMACETR
ncbi:cytochrome P450 [Novosphingobium lentum]|uniref:cytochrome P450 n=1 Tax=Novosphingobium lentum TaxID=145287 RepID=UPI000836C212|nr:cytochrome P450 [Novosphingobium lentum]